MDIAIQLYASITTLCWSALGYKALIRHLLLNVVAISPLA